MAKLGMPTGVRDKRAGSRQPRKATQPTPAGAPTDSSISVKAPADGETVNIRVEKAVGGHIVNESRHDRNFRHESEKTRVVTGSPTIVVETEE